MTKTKETTTQETTTIEITKTDRAELAKVYGTSAKAAVHQALQLCPHPTDLRQPTAAIVRADGQAFNETEPDAPRLTLIGFRCGRCGRLVIELPAGLQL